MKKIDRARLHVHSTFNNTILTLTDLEGRVLAWASPGTRGFKGSKKGTPYAAQLACETLLAKMKEMGIRSLIVTVNGAGQGRNAVVNTLRGAGLRIEDVKNVTPVSHSSTKSS
ncbi:MAG: 30S ribosomal protein S11 [Candidatus Bipolaricaulota bacterium]|nr:30S ribosomal protein S11 [Candidatus Bipolaricaulota bacterium]MCS7275049.1 30S ribosomal protein S11 [Candidatus Bipolaricaulota bacterium]MDW8110377.1 30S ribosomal protein S11 [Candidatus Bipolaricaulota bacterium]MDW8329552.1 30S ribosomal protein S11 [Candidatus Bipolaricaulota bacterium]